MFIEKDGPGNRNQYTVDKREKEEERKVLLYLFKGRFCGYNNIEARVLIFLDSSMVEHTAVNRGVVGSSPTRGVFPKEEEREYGDIAKR